MDTSIEVIINEHGLPQERHEWEQQPAFALDAAAHWWFDRLELEPGRSNRALKRLRKRFSTLFVENYRGAFLQLIHSRSEEEVKSGESKFLYIESARVREEPKEILRRLGLPRETWPRDCQMWMYVRKESIEVIARGNNDPYQQTIYPRFLVR